MRKHSICALAAAIVLAGMIGSTLAAEDQRNPGQRPEQVRPSSPQGDTAPQTEGSGSTSDDLSHSGGVIAPPPVEDRGVRAPPHDGMESTPVIPPPGTPGGDPRVEPK